MPSWSRDIPPVDWHINIGVSKHHCVKGISAVQGGGVRLNNVRVEEEQHVVDEGSLIDGRLMLIAAGKKNKMLVRISS